MNDIYNNEVDYTGIELKGDISLGTVLNILDNENKFGTH